jgi:acyl dehydratase
VSGEEGATGRAWPPFRIGETFTKDVTLDAASIRAFASLTGDTNPLHHDEEVARKSRFGRLIASGAQTSAIMSSLTAALVTERCPSLGLEIMFRFRRAVLADEPLRIEWEVIEMEPKPKLGAYLLTFSGKLVKLADGEVAVSGHAKTLIFREQPA